MLPHETAKKLLTLAGTEVEGLNDFPAERELVYKTGLGAVASFGDDLPWLSERENADTPPHRWARDREIRAVVVRWLCVSPVAKGLIGPDGIRLSGVRIPRRSPTRLRRDPLSGVLIKVSDRWYDFTCVIPDSDVCPHR